MTTQTMPRNGQHVHDDAELAEGELLNEIIEKSSVKLDAREAAFMEMQFDNAVRRPRSIKQFVHRATEMATLDEETAASCTYAVPRDGKTIQGPSIRLVEICVMAWGNLHVEARVVDIGETHIKAAATCRDMQSNNCMGQEIVRRITKKNGQRYSDDMITTTCNAAMSIALRNACLRIIPRSYVEMIRQKAVEVVRGDVQTLKNRRDAAVQHWAKQGIEPSRLLAVLGKPSVDDIDLDDLVTMKGFWTAIKSGEAKLADCFPPLETKSQSLAEKIKGAKKEEEKPPAAPVEQMPEPSSRVEPKPASGTIDDQPPPPAQISSKTLTRLQDLLSKLDMVERSFRDKIGIKKWAELLEQDAIRLVADLENQLAAKRSQREPGEE